MRVGPFFVWTGDEWLIIPNEAAIAVALIFSSRESSMARTFRMEVIDRLSAKRMKQLPGMERVRLACALGDSLRRMVKHHLRQKHPTWTEEQICLELLRRDGHGSN